MKERYHKQKILFICQNFWPENFRSTDVVNNLVNSGCEVDVLTSNPNYPEGKIYKGYKWYNSNSENYKKKFIIHRVPTIPRGNSNYLLIFLNYLSFIFFGILFGVFKLRKKKFDVILVFAASPIFQSIVGYIFKILKNIKLVIWVQDLWPENLQALNIIKNKFILKIIYNLTSYTYNLSDILVAQSKSFQKILKKRSKKKIFYLPNFAENLNKKIIKYNKNKKFILLYAGNIGKAQKLITLLKSANELRNNKKLIIKIFGDGVDLKKLKYYKNKNNLKNVKFYRKVPSSQIYAEYKKADALYLSLAKNEFLNFTIPAKLQTYFSMSRPIIASASGETKEIINQSKAGFCSNPENEKMLTKNILKMINLKKNEIKSLKNNSKKYYLKNFDNNLVNMQLIRILNYKK